MQAQTLVRVFKAGSVLYPDPAPELPPERAVRLYPQFAHASLTGPVREGDRLVWTVDKGPVGTKG